MWLVLRLMERQGVLIWKNGRKVLKRVLIDKKIYIDWFIVEGYFYRNRIFLFSKGN